MPRARQKTKRRAAIPKKLRLCGRTFDLIVEPVSTLNRHTFGLHQPFAAQTIVSSDTADEEQKATVLHEIVHDIDHLVHCEMKERDVCAFASALFAIMRDNPALIRWLMER